uniref:Uncharacterized protein n=1 Tax=Avena sativa TaxID=4498 RepID=A0ACD5TQB3_AVESA
MPDNIEWAFNVQNDSLAFVPRINDLRYQLRDLAREQLYDNLYMLRPFTSVPLQWLRVRMQDGGGTEIMLWVRTGNLYVVGFKGTGTWEFGRRGDRDWQQLLSGSQPLGFDGGYTGNNLEDLITGPPPGRQRRADLGRQQLVDGIRGLAAYTGGGGQQLRSWLRTMVVTISESIRSQQVCSYVGDLLRDSSSGWLTDKLICIIRNWEKVSQCLILSANNPDIPDLYRCLRAKGVCGNTYEARQVVAIVYHGPSTSQQQQQQARARRSSSDGGGGAKVDDVATGLTFVEVLAVQVDSGGEDRCDLYGTATLDDGLDPVDVSRREWSSTQPLAGTRGPAEMTGPARAIWAYDEVVFDLDLLSRGTVARHVPRRPGQQGAGRLERAPEARERLQHAQGVHGGRGLRWPTIRYAVLTNAVVATVAVALPNGRDLYGSIMGWSSSLYQHKMPLFKMELAQGLRLSPRRRHHASHCSQDRRHRSPRILSLRGSRPVGPERPGRHVPRRPHR